MLDMITEVTNLIAEYDQNKGWRRWFSWFPWLGYHADIRELKRAIDSGDTNQPEFNWYKFFSVLRNREADQNHLSARLLTNLIIKLFGSVENVNDSLAKHKSIQAELLVKIGFADRFEHHDLTMYSMRLVDVFHSLYSKGNLSSDLAIILMHPWPLSMYDALKILSDAGINTPENYADMIAYELPHELANSYVAFSHENLLDQYREKLKSRKRHYKVSEAVNILKSNDLLTEENIESIISSQVFSSENLAKAFVILSKLNLLTEENRRLLIVKEIPHIVAKAVKMLAKANILTKEFLEDTLNHPGDVCNAFSTLKSNTILTAATVSDVLAYSGGDPYKLAKMYQLLSRATIFTDENRLAWRQIPDKLIQIVFNCIAESQFTPHLNDELLRIAGQQNIDIQYRHDRLYDYIRNWDAQRGNRHPTKYNNNLNYAQSKHKSCVEQSVSESAVRLNELYGKNLDEAKILAEMQSWIDTLDNTEMSEKAKLAFPRLRKSDFVNVGSKISTPRVLALIWTAIHDDNQRSKNCTIDEAKQKLIEALFDCQCSYNFDANDKYVAGEEDKSSCIAGEFITVVSKMDGIHPAVKIIYITEQDNAEKIQLPAMVKKQAAVYLQEQQKTAHESSDKQLEFNKLISDFRKEGIAAIWEKIRTAVFEIFFGEYGSLYNDDKNNQRLNEIVDAQEYMPVRDTQDLLEKHNISEIAEVEKAKTPSQASSSGSVVKTGMFAPDSVSSTSDELNKMREKRLAYFGRKQ